MSLVRIPTRTRPRLLSTTERQPCEKAKDVHAQNFLVNAELLLSILNIHTVHSLTAH